MFTLKHVTESGEALYWGEQVITQNYTNQLSGLVSPDIDQVSYLDDGQWHGLKSGVVYVMNRDGATVAKYDMRAASTATLTPAEVLARRATDAGGYAA